MRLQKIYWNSQICLVIGIIISLWWGGKALAGSSVAKESFESLKNIYASQEAEISLSKDIVKEGKYSLKFTATIDKNSRHSGIGIMKQFGRKVDLSKYNTLRFWIYPDSSDGTYDMQVRMNAVVGGKWKWFNLGSINSKNTPNRSWSQHSFDISNIPRREVGRVFDFVIWQKSGSYKDGEKITFYIDGLEFIPEKLAMNRKTEKSVGKEIQLLKPPKTISTISEEDYWIFKNDEMKIAISKETGSLSKVVSLKPTPLDLIPTPSEGLVVKIEDLSGKWEEPVQKLIKSKLTSDGVTVWLEPERHKVLQAIINYRLLKDYLLVKIKIIYKISKNPGGYPLANYRVSIGGSFNPTAWKRQLFLSSKVVQRQPEEKYIFRRYKGGPGNYLMGILEGKDRFFLYGNPDISAYGTIAPNFYPRRLPYFFIERRFLWRENWDTFELIYKFLPKPENSFVDVIRWWGEHIYASDPELNKWGPIRLTHKRARTIGKGNVCILAPVDTFLSPYISKERVKLWEKKMLEMKMTNLWFMNWNDWRESFPSSGKFQNLAGAINMSAEKLRAEIKRLQAQGFKVYLYCRETWNFRKSTLENNQERDKPPFKRWIKRTPPDGASYYIRYIWQDAPPQKEKRNWLHLSIIKRRGFDEPILQAMIDFGNPEARAWYIKRLKEAIDFYQPDGIAWDMSWGHHEDVLKVQYEIYNWMRQKYPEKRILQNYGFGQPSQLFSDLVLVEHGTSEPNWLTYQAARAFGTGITTFLNELRFKNEFKGKGISELEKEYVKRIKVALASGSSWAMHPISLMDWRKKEARYGWPQFPIIKKLSTLADFSAKVNAVPLVTRPQVISTESPVIGAVWADKNHLLAAIYRYQGKGKVLVKINRELLRKNDQVGRPKLKFTFIGESGLPKSSANAKYSYSRDYLTIEVSLAEGDLVLVESI